MSKLDKRRKGVYGPPLGKKFIVYIDDINMPEKDEVGSQPSIELMRQLLDHKIWYDHKELFPMKLIDMQLIGTMRPPDGSSNALSGRFMRHFNTINIDLLSDTTVITVFSRIVLWHLDTKGFSKEFDPCIQQIVTATLDVHKFAIKSLLPTPEHPHYFFSLQEFSRVICGVLLSVPETMEDLNAMKRLWTHETFRVYYDRLVSPNDQTSFFIAVKDICQNRLCISFQDLFSHLNTGVEITHEDLRKLIICDFSDPKSEDKFYKEVENMEQFRNVSESLLAKYNSVSRKPMDLVLFNFALEHLCRISRVLKQPESHTLLIGVGGSGRQSLSRLAAHISGYEFHEIEMGKDHGMNNWRQSLKNILRSTSKTLKSHVLFLYDNQLLQEQFLEDINNILYSGEIPNLFNHEEKQDIIEQMRNIEKQLDKSAQTDGSGPALFNLFVRRVKENVHLILAMSPFADIFHRSIAHFPGLLNRCTINWVHQWPDDALNFVSKKFLHSLDLKDDNTFLGCIELCEHFHNSTIELSKSVLNRHNIYNYVTPASYLELNCLFKQLLIQHRQQIEEKRQMYEVSLEKLKGAESQVVIMQAEIEALQPNLQKASQEVDQSMVIVEKELAEVNEMEKTLKLEEIQVMEKKKTVENITKELEAEFTEVNGILETSIDSLSSLTQSELNAARSVKSPSLCLKLNLEVICLMKGIKPDKAPETSGGKMAEDFWGPSKRLLNEVKFIESLANFDKDNIPAKNIKLIRDKYIGNSDLNPEKSKTSMPALDAIARALYCWIIAIDMYEKVYRNTAPKREALLKSEKEHDYSLAELTSKKQKLKEVQEHMKNLNDTLQEKKQKKAELENEVDLCSRKLERAEQLITGFGGERTKWRSQSHNLHLKLACLTGDILIAAGTVAYLGAFPADEREKQITEWKLSAQRLGILFSQEWSLCATLGDPISIQSWYMNGLLKDDFSTDNGIILSSAKRWVLMVDPQDIANKWIKTTEKSNQLTILKQSDKDFLRTLENCIQFGSPVLLENVGDCLDPALEPLLQKQTFQQGGSICIKLGESTIEYSKDFKMYITTRLRNPHFPPETTSKITLVNFSITKDGLVDQLLGIIVTRERPELEEERSQITGQLNENDKTINEIEHKILSILHESHGNILEDENAIKNLSSSKVLANEITEKQTIAKSTFRRLNDNRLEYHELANYGVNLFFIGSTLSSINSMYQYSLSWFINLFCGSIDSADKSEDIGERLSNIRTYFLHSFFANTVIGLFDDDKILFSFLLACSLSVDPIIGSPVWDNVIHSFNTDHKNKDTSSQNNNLLPFEKLALNILKSPASYLTLIKSFVEMTLGPEFVNEEPLDISRAYTESVAASPMIFILGEDVDPLKYIFR